MLDDFSIPAKQRLLTYFIDQEPGLGLTNDNVKLSLPRQGVFTDKNTEVTASFVSVFMHKPTTVGHYNRLSLQSYFKNNFGVEQPPLNSASDLSSVLAAGNYSVYDHTTDNRIVTDNSKPFMIYNDPSIVTTPDQIGADVFVFLEQSVTGFESMKYGFENDQNGRLIYLSDIAGMFEIRIKGTVISDPNTDVEFRFRQSNPTDAVGHNKFLSVNTGVTGVVDVDMLLHRSLMPSGIYGLAIRNQSNLANVELSNLLFTIREF